MTTIEISKLNTVSNKFELVAEIGDSYHGLVYDEILNGIGNSSFSLSVFSRYLTNKNFTERASHIVIKDNDNIVWAGPYFNPNGQVVGLEGDVNITAFSHLFHFSHRFTGKKVSLSGDQVEILIDQLTEMQSRPYSDLKVDYVEYVSGTERTEVFEYKAFSEIVRDYTEYLDGFDIEMRPVAGSDGHLDHFVLVIYQPRRGRLLQNIEPFVLGGRNGNIKDFGFGHNGEFFNDLTLEGAGIDGDQVLTANIGNLDLQERYTRVESVQFEKSIQLQETLDVYAEALLNDKGLPKWDITLKVDDKTRPLPGEYAVGDVIPIDVDIRKIKKTAGDLIAFKGYGRITSVKTEITPNGDKNIYPKLSFYK